jgi:hypothetical protein
MNTTEAREQACVLDSLHCPKSGCGERISILI